jgi:hypothetical protein
MFDFDTKNYKFNSGLTYDEADALVEHYCSQYKDDPDILIAVLKVHLKTAVRDSKQFRNVVGACIGDNVRAA